MLAKKIGGEIVLLIVFSFSIIVLKVYKEFNFVAHDSSCIFLFMFGMYISKFVVKYVTNCLKSFLNCGHSLLALVAAYLGAAIIGVSKVVFGPISTGNIA